MKFTQRIIRLIGNIQRDTALSAINNVPCGHGLEVVIRETPKARSLDANARMWAGPLKDIAEQVWVNNRQYSAELWHVYFKTLNLPDETNEPYIFELVKNPETYRKWDMLPNGERELIGSTTDLTPYGFGIYLDQIYSFGAEKGVSFAARDYA
jgi:hypothetical protein